MRCAFCEATTDDRRMIQGPITICEECVIAASEDADRADDHCAFCRAAARVYRSPALATAAICGPCLRLCVDILVEDSQAARGVQLPQARVIRPRR